MAEEASKRVDKSIENAFEQLDRKKIRKVQRDMHLCASKCCDDSNKSTKQVQVCIQKCQNDFNNVRAIIQTEFGHFQKKLELCAQQCESNIRETMPVEVSQADAGKYKNQFESCIVKCADASIDSIPSMLKRIEELLSE